MTPATRAERFVAARARRAKITLGAHERPADWAAARETAALSCPGEPYGWKLGATNEAGRVAFGLTRPIYGPLAAGEIYEVGDEVIVPPLPAPLAEPEIVVRFGATVSPKAEPRSDAELMALIDGVAAAVEFPSTCLAAPEQEGVLSFVADRAGVGLLATGEFVSADRISNLNAAPARLLFNGRERARGNSNLLIGGVLGAMRDFLVEAGLDGRTLHPNDVISTGGLAPAKPLDHATSVAAIIEGLPKAEFQLRYV